LSIAGTVPIIGIDQKRIRELLALADAPTEIKYLVQNKKLGAIDAVRGNLSDGLFVALSYPWLKGRAGRREATRGL